MVAHRHMHDYGTTSEQLAEISVATRYEFTNGLDNLRPTYGVENPRMALQTR